MLSSYLVCEVQESWKWTSTQSTSGMLVPEGSLEAEETQPLPLPVDWGLPVYVNMALTQRGNEAVHDYCVCHILGQGQSWNDLFNLHNLLMSWVPVHMSYRWGHGIPRNERTYLGKSTPPAPPPPSSTKLESGKSRGRTAHSFFPLLPIRPSFPIWGQTWG